jgi:hypothetical protein
MNADRALSIVEYLVEDFTVTIARGLVEESLLDYNNCNNADLAEHDVANVTISKARQVALDFVNANINALICGCVDGTLEKNYLGAMLYHAYQRKGSGFSKTASSHERQLFIHAGMHPVTIRGALVLVDHLSPLFVWQESDG